MDRADDPHVCQKPAWRVVATVTSGAIVSVVGLAALVGWRIGSSLLAALGSNTIPMAPSSAVLFVALGVVVAFSARPGGQRAALARAAVVVLAASVAFVLLVTSLLGIHLPAERLGMGAAGAVRGIAIGHMSPATACGFLLACVSLLLSMRTRPGRSARSIAAFATACALQLAALVFLLAYLYGKPLLYGGGLTPPAINTTLAFAALGVGLLVLTRPISSAREAPPSRPISSGWFLLAFILSAGGLVATGYLYHRDYERHFRGEVEQHILAIADLKVSELTQWRRERIGDGTLFFDNRNFSNLVEACIDTPDDRELHDRLEIWLQRSRAAYHYDRVFVVDGAGVEIASAPGTPRRRAVHLQSPVSQSLLSRQVTLVDFHREDDGRAIRLSVLSPIFSAHDKERALGVVVLGIDPDAALYPIIRRWPTPSRSAETLVVRRDGDDVLFLNPLRFHDGPALSLREPLSNNRLPAARAALGYQGSFEGLDYRGVEVIAALRTVPDSPWSLVARIDSEEVYAPLTERLWMMVLLVSGLLLGAGAVFGFMWRQQTMWFYRTRFEAAEALRASEARYRTLLENAPVAVFINRQDRVVEANQACLHLFGTSSKEQLLGKSPFELFHPDCHDLIRGRIRALREHDEVVPLIEERIVRLDGAVVDVAVSAAPFNDRGVKAIHVVLIDVTERKKSEQALRASEAELTHRNDELTRFTYTVSHDLKSPLVTIQTFLGYLEQDLQKNDDANVQKDLGYIRSAAHKMSRLLQELLELSRVGRVKNPSEDITLQEVVGEALQLVAGRVAERGARVDVTSEPVVLHGDRVRLVEVFQNLLDNALKFTGTQASPRVEVVVEAANGQLVLAVRDNGAGIDPRHITKLFGLFEKLDPKSDGTGIGLALVRRIVEVHGGRIWAESDGPGHGSCFRFTLAGTTMAPGKDAPR